MTYQQFLEILLNYKKYSDTISDAYDIGLDLLEGKLSTSDYVLNIVKTSIESHYGEMGWDWVSWFMFENDYGQKGLEAYDENKNLICHSYESLYQYIESNHKSK